LRLITTFVNNGITKCIPILGNCKIFHSHGYTCWNKVAHCSHAWIHTLRSSKLIITITFRQIEVGSLGSWPNNTHGEKNERKACQMKLYLITSHGICKSQSWVWPFWNPYFHKLCFFCLHHPFILFIYFKMVSWSCVMINQCLFTLLLEFLTKYCGWWIFWLKPQIYYAPYPNTIKKHVFRPLIMYLVNSGLLKNLELTIDHLKDEKLKRNFHSRTTKWCNRKHY
jgi:hypothetical protein